MQIKGLFFAFCLLATAFLQASNTLNPSKRLPEPAHTEFSCNVPAPNNFQVLDVGTTMVKLGWDYQADALGGYRIRIYRTSDNFLVSTKFKAQDQLDMVEDGLTMGIAYHAVINSRCSNYSNSGQESTAPFHTLILDLIVVGYQGSVGSSSCIIPTQSMSCPFSNSGEHFKVTGPNIKPKYFLLKRAANPGLYIYECKVSTNDPTNQLYFTCELMVPPTSECLTDYISIWAFIQGVQTEIATFTVNTTDIPELKCIYIRPNYTIEKQSDLYGGGRYRDASSESTHPATASPNPFSETLDVFLPNPSTENIHLQLFNLSGQQVLQQQFAGGQQQYSLSTAHLSPGFYLLRIEADGEVQTLKVIKSE